MIPEGLQALISEFHRKYKYPYEDFPSVSSKTRLFRLQLMTEELAELADAFGFPYAAIKLREVSDMSMKGMPCFSVFSPVPVADALADLDVTVNGTAVSFGLPLDALVREVHRSNMTKEINRNYADKPIKGRDFIPPDIIGVLKKCG